MNKSPFICTLVLASPFNSNLNLETAIRNIISQDIGFPDHIQLFILRNMLLEEENETFSALREEYPDNIEFLDSSLFSRSQVYSQIVEKADSRYIVLLHSFDTIPDSFLSAVCTFFDANLENTDVVVTPSIFHNYSKATSQTFNCESTVLDLQTAWKKIPFCPFGVFVKTDSFKQSSGLVEDHVFANSIYIKIADMLDAKKTIGYCSEVTFEYNDIYDISRDAFSENETAFGSQMKYAYKYLSRYKETYSKIPLFVQNAVLQSIKEHLKTEIIPFAAFSKGEKKAHYKLIKKCSKLLDDKVIIKQQALNTPIKTYLLKEKHGRYPKLYKNEDGLIYFSYGGKLKISNLAKTPLNLSFMKFKKDRVIIEGSFTACKYLYENPPIIYAMVNGEKRPLIMKRTKYKKTLLNREISREYIYRLSFSLKKKTRVQFFCASELGDVHLLNLKFGIFFAITKIADAYYIKQNRVLTHDNNTLVFSKTNLFTSPRSFEKKYIASLEQFGQDTAECIELRKKYFRQKKLKKKPIWIIADRFGRAGDNAEVFFTFIQKHYADKIDAYFILRSDSSDYDRLKETGNIVEPYSEQHYLLYLLSDYCISSQSNLPTICPLSGAKRKYFADIICEKRFVFIQHGITMNDLSKYLNKFQKNFFGFVTTGYPEYNSIINGEYYYDKKTVWLTGFVRFDRLNSDEKNLITIMPTWRKYLAPTFNHATGLRTINADFVKSDYFKFFNALLNNEKLLAAAKKYGYRIQYKPHPLFGGSEEYFDKNDMVDLLPITSSYKEVYAQSKLMVTDYSSVVFDFSYMRKPVIYTQFDKELFFSGAHSFEKGYFDHEKDGFGEVEYDLESTVDRIIEYMENGCALKEKYRNRIDAFFAYSDQNNCQRLYDKLIENSPNLLNLGFQPKAL